MTQLPDRLVRPRWIVAAALFSLLAVAPRGATGVSSNPVAAPVPVPQDEYHWLGPDLEIVPLTDEEILEFLRTADIVDREHIDIGINGIDRLTLEKDGIRLRAGFRQVDHAERDTRVGDEQYLLFRDYFHFECAAYAVARLLGIENVPPAIPRRVDNEDGSLQLWVEGLFESHDGVRSPDAIGWARQVWTMKFFDALLYNVDRNPGNLKIDRQYRLWLIDHTRAFQHKSKPYQLDAVQHVRTDVWERLQRLTREDFEDALAGLLEPIEIKYLMDRRAALIEHVTALLAERPESAVLY